MAIDALFTVCTTRTSPDMTAELESIMTSAEGKIRDGVVTHSELAGMIDTAVTTKKTCRGHCRCGHCRRKGETCPKAQQGTWLLRALKTRAEALAAWVGQTAMSYPASRTC